MKRGFGKVDKACESGKNKYEALLNDHLHLQKYETLLHDHLYLPKELVLKKKKLYVAKQKRENLSSEVRFLRQRHKYLLQMRSSNIEEDLNQTHNVNVKRRKLLGENMKCTKDEAQLCRPGLISVSSTSSLIVAESKRKCDDQITHKPLGYKSKAKKLVDYCRRVGKREGSWFNKMSLETIEEEQEEQEQEQEELIGHELVKRGKFRNCSTDERRVGQIRCL